MDEQEWLTSADPAAMLGEVTAPHNSDLPRPDERISDRKLRLFACACARQVWHLLTDERSRKAVEVAERFADDDSLGLLMDDAQDEARHAWEAESNIAGLACYATARGIADAVARIVRHHMADLPPLATQASLLRDIIGNPYRPRLDECDLYGPMNHRDAVQILSLAQAAYEVRPGRPHKRCRCGRPYEMLCKKSMPPLAWCANCREDGGFYADAAARDGGTLDPDRLAILADALEEAGCVRRPCLTCAVAKARGGPGRDRCGCVESDILAHLRSPGPHVRGCWAVDLVLGKERSP